MRGFFFFFFLRSVYFSTARWQQLKVNNLLECDGRHGLFLRVSKKLSWEIWSGHSAAVRWKCRNLCSSTLSALHHPIYLAVCIFFAHSPCPPFFFSFFYHLWLSSPSLAHILISLQFSRTGRWKLSGRTGLQDKMEVSEWTKIKSNFNKK